MVLFTSSVDSLGVCFSKGVRDLSVKHWQIGASPKVKLHNHKDLSCDSITSKEGHTPTLFHLPTDGCGGGAMEKRQKS